MLTKTARWLTLTNGFHPIQRAPGYDRCSLTGGTHSLLLAALIVVWLRRNVVLARLRDRTLELRRDCAPGSARAQ